MNFKNLTPEQRIEIARLIKPDMEWTNTVSLSCPWQGWDLVSNTDEGKCFIQISFDGSKISFYDEGLFEYPVSDPIIIEKIRGYGSKE